MTTIFTGIDQWEASIVGPAGGETVTAASVVDPMTLLANRSMYLRARFDETHRVVHRAADWWAGTASIIDLKTLTTFTPILTLTGLPALLENDVIEVEASWGVQFEGTGEMRFGAALSTAPTTVSAEFRHVDSYATAHVRQFAMFDGIRIAADAAAGADLHIVGRVTVAATTAMIHRAAFMRYRIVRLGEGG